ncbi:hypothetical protein M1843_13580 [Isoptericola sp. 4D.3]|uniref:Uncharacterized protein n=1 Tax=Isoptericola peretonis TaxID=2918523 RepID=A0ABT0J5M9_9MICO|nr:hypothetical protein [Isoptericola sp. 4D.3]
MKIRARLRTTFHRREKLPPLDSADRRPPSWATDPRLEPDRMDMRNRRSADAFGMGYLDGRGGGGMFGDSGGGGGDN